MASERGLPSIPRGLGRELTTYLQALQAVLLRLSGLTRGSESSRALRVSDGSVSTGTTTASVGQGSITTRHIADNAVTSAKITDGAVTGSKIAPSAVTDRAIQAGSITEHALAAGAVTENKLAIGILPVFFTGAAIDGETVTLPGIWRAAPAVVISSFSQVVAAEDATEAIGITDLQETADDGVWQFTASGNFTWVAMGFAQ